jgi:Outer membrane protein beta-barrel domain
MKKVLFFLLFTASLNVANAQIYPQGSTNFSVGYGIIPYGNIVTTLLESEVNNLKINKTGPIFVKGEYALADNFTIGLNVNFTDTKGTFTLDSASVVGKYSGTIGLRSTSFIGRINYTIPFANDKAGFMIGGGVGYRNFRTSYTDTDPSTPIEGAFTFPIPVTGELTFGLRYYFTQNIGIYTEFGLTRAILQGGITARF